jgi:hypothetical protein
MKKLLFTLAAASIGFFALAQENAPDKGAEFDKKFRFGLRINPQPTWLVSGDKNNIPSSTGFGFGFGLNMEYRFSEIAALLTGIGGDFENGKYKFKKDVTNGYEVVYWMDEVNEFKEPSGSITSATSVLMLKERKINTTFITIPAILKLSTKEYNGMKYFGMFGGEIGIRVKAKAEDTYYETRKYLTDTTFKVISGESTESDINIGEEMSLLPLRVGFNAGAGLEYRLGGSTSLFFSLNYFRAFTNMMRKESNYLYYRTDGVNYRHVKQNLAFTAIRINVGIMF